MVFIVLPEVNKLRLRQNRSKLRLRPSGSGAQHYYIVKQQTGFQAEIKTYVALVPERIQDRNASSPYAHSTRKKQTR